MLQILNVVSNPSTHASTHTITHANIHTSSHTCTHSSTYAWVYACVTNEGMMVTTTVNIFQFSYVKHEQLFVAWVDHLSYNDHVKGQKVCKTHLLDF